MIRTIILILLTLLQYVMMVAALASWIPQLGQSKIGRYLRIVPEPIVVPFRYLLNKTSMTRGLPVDVSFLLAFLAIQVIKGFFY